MAKRMTIEDLAHITKAGFDEQGKRITALETAVGELKHEVAQNGDAVVHLIQHFDIESAANQAAHQRIEGRLDKVETGLNKVEGRLDKVEVKLDKVEGRLDKVEVKLDKVDTRLFRIENHLQMEPLPV